MSSNAATPGAATPQGLSRRAIARRRKAAKKAAEEQVASTDERSAASSEVYGLKPPLIPTACVPKTWAQTASSTPTKTEAGAPRAVTPPVETSPGVFHAPAAVNSDATLPSSPPQTPKIPSSPVPLEPVLAQPASPTELVVYQKLDNLLIMIRQQREQLVKGLTIVVYVGSVAIEGIYKRAAMAVSSVLNKHFMDNPESCEYQFHPGSISPEAAQWLLVYYLKEACEGFEAYAVRQLCVFENNVAVLRAAHMLSMERYCGSMMHTYRKYLNTELPWYHEIVAVEENATSAKDPLFTGMVNHLCHDRYKDLMPDPEVFEDFLQEHPRLAAAMAAADYFFASR